MRPGIHRRVAPCLLGAVLLALAARPLLPQQAPEPPADKKADDKAPAAPRPAPAPARGLKEELWYRIVEKDEPIGYGHYTLSESVFKGNHVLRFVYEEEIRPRKLLDLETSARFSAVTSYDYDFIEGEMGAFKGEEERRYNLRIAQERLYLVTARGNFDTSWDQKDVGLECMLGKWLQHKEPAEGKIFRFYHFTGLPEPATDELQITVREHATRAFADLNTEGFSCSITGRRGEKPLDRTIFLDSEGRILEIKEGEILRHMVKSEEAAKAGQRFELAARGRRDPFRIPLTPKDSIESKGAAPTNATDKPLPEEQVRALVQAAKDGVERMKDARKKLQANPKALEEALGNEYDTLMTTFNIVHNRQKVPNDKYRVELNQLKAEADQIYSGMERLVTQMRKLRDEAKDLFEQEKYPDVEAKRAEAEPIAKKPELAGTRFAPQIDELYAEVRKYAERGTLRREFESKKPHITGIIYHLVPKEVPYRMGLELLGDRVAVETTLRVPVSSSTCFLTLSGQDVAKGDGEEVASDLRVSRIERGAVIFDYRGEEIKVEMALQNKQP
ncbi:MAG: hypothetical protein HYZ53_27530 [Planctomycetes bacterium]|nr:hypothetical protein [Planctomycetota bacterium]